MEWYHDNYLYIYLDFHQVQLKFLYKDNYLHYIFYILKLIYVVHCLYCFANYIMIFFNDFLSKKCKILYVVI